MHPQRPTLFAAALFVIAVLLLAACAPAAAPAPAPTAVPPTAIPPTAVPPTAAPAAAATSAPAQAPAASAMQKTNALTVTDNAKFGKIVTDATGMTLYMYPNDTREPSVSNCYDACAQRWPAFLADASGNFELKSDLDAKLFGTTTRKDGAKQVTFNGWPLYYWQNDKKPGDTLGFGVGDIWWVMQPDGAIITAPTTVALDVVLGAGRDGDQSGTARLTAKGAQTDVAITLKTAGPSGVAQPAHIHDGACPVPGQVKYPLKDVVDGKSTTTLDVPLAQLLTGGFAINVHQDAANIGKYVACGGIPQGSVVKLDAGRDGSQPGTAVLLANTAKTDVYLFIKPVVGATQPAHIHSGECPVPGDVKYPLSDVVNGKSKTSVDAGLADLLKGGFAINTHLSKADISKYVTCGAIR